MSKFAKPKNHPPAGPDQIAKVINAAPTHEVAEERDDVRFTMTLPPDMAGEVDRARKRASLTRLAWIRIAIAEKLERGGK